MLDAAPLNRLMGCKEKRCTCAGSLGIDEVGSGCAVDVVSVVGRDAVANAEAAAAPGGARVLGRLRGGDGFLSGEGLGDCGGSPEDMATGGSKAVWCVCMYRFT